MIRIDPVSIARSGWIVFCVAFAALLPSAAQADCAQWDISGDWRISQSNGFVVWMHLEQTGTTISGTGSFSSTHNAPSLPIGPGTEGPPLGPISGSIYNNNIELSTSWGGEYKGGIGSDAFIGGVTSPKGGGETATWRSDRAAKCLTATTPPSQAEPAAPNKPVKVLGKKEPPSAEPAVKMNPATVTLDVEIYNKPGGKDAGAVVIGELAKGTQGVIANCQADNWCIVSQWIGNTPVHRGWVYSGPGYESLKF